MRRTGDGEPWLTVVGVVADIRQRRLNEDVQPMVYVPFQQERDEVFVLRFVSFVARTAGLAPEDGILMLCFPHAGREVRIAHVTLHAGVRHALSMISTQRVLATLRAVDRTLKRMGDQAARDCGPYGVQLIFQGGHHAEVRPRAANGPEQIGMLQAANDPRALAVIRSHLPRDRSFRWCTSRPPSCHFHLR